jgi:hypothetical protein
MRASGICVGNQVKIGKLINYFVLIHPLTPSKGGYLTIITFTAKMEIAD